MKSFNILIVVLLVSFSFYGQNKSEINDAKDTIQAKYTSFGEEIEIKGGKNSVEMSEAYANLVVSDTLKTKFSGTVLSVCKKKGCWMKLELSNGKEAMVRFKDYGFFMPKDIEGKEVVVNGLAFVEEMSVENQKHYAKDAGKSDAEVAKITKVKKTYAFQADGVLLKK
ncbi:MAG: DUF4920 domain-containing protein [Cellulophaga sp.]